MKHSKHSVQVFLLFVVLLFTFSPSGQVFAEGEEVPPEEAPVEVGQESPTMEASEAFVEPTTAVEEGAEVATEEPVVEATAEATAETTNADADSNDSEGTKETISDIVNVLSESEKVVADENGEILSFASAKTEKLLSSRDPFFWDGDEWIGYTVTGEGCPTNVTCQPSSTPFQTAVTEAPAGTTIYVAAGNYDEDVSINKSNLSFLGFTSITVSEGNSTIAESDYEAGNALVRSFSLNADFNTNSGVYAPIVYILSDTASIQDGISLVKEGGTVNVGAGTFTENIDINKTGVTLQSTSLSVIDGDYQGNVISVNADEVTVDGFEIIDGYNGILGETSGSIFKNNFIHGHLNYVESNGTGICLWGDNDNNQILNNTIYNVDRQGVFIGYSDTSKISEGNIISGNTIYDYGNYTQKNGPDESAYGIQFWIADNNTISENEIYGYDSGWWFSSAIYLCEANDNIISENYLHGNNQAITQFNYATPAKTNTAYNNNIVGNAKGISNYSLAFNAEYNYWGCNDGSGSVGCDSVNASVDYDPWLIDPDGDSVFESSDGSGGYVDNCPATYNPDQKDSDGDGIGNACDATPYGEPAPLAQPQIILTTTDESGSATTSTTLTAGQPALIELDVETSAAFKEETKQKAQESVAKLEGLSEEEKEEVLNLVNLLIDIPADATMDIPANAASEGSQVVLQHVSDPSALPAEIENGVFLGSMLTIEGTDASGEELDQFSEAVTIRFTLPEELVIPSGMSLAIQYYDESAGAWVSVPLVLEDGSAFANITQLGTYALVLVQA